MNILIVNPNTSEAITALINAAAAAAASDVVITAVTARRGVAYIATRAEAVIGAASALELLAEHWSGQDAAIIAAFGDPGLEAAREILPIPVVGLAEAGLFTACMLGRRYAIVTFATALEPWYRECVAYHGVESRLAGIYTLDSPFADISAVQDEKEALLVELCGRASQGADVVILAGAPLAGMARRICDRVPVPLVDCVSAAVHLTKALTSQRPRLRLAQGKASSDLTPALASLLTGESVA